MRRHERHYQEHAIDVVRHRLGRTKADILLVDASRGAETHQRTLSRAVGGTVSEYMDGGKRFLAISFQGDGFAWHGGDLQLDDHIPQTAQTLLAGRRLGDVVEGTGADDHRIEEVGDRPEGTRIRLTARLVPASCIGLPMRHRLAGPFRRGLRIAVGEWLEFGDKTHQREPTLGDMAFQIALLSVSVLGLVAGMGAMTAYGPGGTAIAVVVVGPMFLYLVTGLTYSICADVRRRRRKRA
jgi:hypothetical protein